MPTDTYGGQSSQQQDPDQLLAVGEAAKLLGVSVSTLQRWDNEGILRALRTPTKQRRYRRADLLAQIHGAA
jgi:excisionase family DNA binding protein